MKKELQKFADNETFKEVKNTRSFGTFVDKNGEVKSHKFAKLVFLSKETYHKEGSKNVVCKLSCYLNFDIPYYWQTVLTNSYNNSFTVTGIATCSDEDEFDIKKGKIIAQVKAENAAYRTAEHMIETIQEQLYNFGNALTDPLINLKNYQEHNKNFIEKVINDEITPKH